MSKGYDMKVPNVLLLLVTIAFCQTIYGQSANNNYEDEILDQIESSAIPSLIDNEFDFSNSKFQQNVAAGLSIGNMAVIVHSGDGNQSTVSQSGNENSAILSRLGSNNVDDVTQNGSLNSFISDVTGIENYNTIDQNGSNNAIDQTLEGDGMIFNLSQHGTNHELIQVENDGLTHGYSVNQTGNGMKVTITNRNGLP